MGQDKARLPWHGLPLVQFQWQRLESLAAPATIIGGDFDLPATPDLYPGEGPLGAILSALSASPAALILAVDMPLVTTQTLQLLLQQAAHSPADALVPQHPDGKRQPLAAIYLPSAQPKLAAAFHAGTRRVLDALATLELQPFPADPDEFRAMNTPAEYTEATRV